VTNADEMPPIARPAIAAGALFTDDAGRVLLVKPTYKDYWDIPGGYVEPGESPRAACIREVREELSIEPPLGSALVIDWAPLEGEGDKILFIFDGGKLSVRDYACIKFADGELAGLRFVTLSELDQYTPERLARRLEAAATARQHASTEYTEHGSTYRRA
jgi:8-oxo-dGTP diphosphatase